MKYVVKMYPATCPSEETIMKICDTEQDAEDYIQRESSQYSKCEFYIETVYN